MDLGSGVTDPGHDLSGRGPSILGLMNVILAWPGQKGRVNSIFHLNFEAVKPPLQVSSTKICFNSYNEQQYVFILVLQD